MPGSCWRPPGCGCPARRWRRCTSGPRAGRPGCGWRRWRWPGTRTRPGSPRSSPAPSGPWRSTCWPRCWTGSRKRSGGCCCAPASWSGSTGTWPDLLTGDDGRGAGPAGPGTGRCVRGVAGRRAVLVPLPPDVRRPAAAGAAAHRAGRGDRAARRRRRVVRRARVPGRGDPPRPGRPGLGPGGPPARRPLAQAHLDGQAATVHELLAGFPAGLLRGRRRARRDGRGRRAGAGIAGGSGAVPGPGRA